ncbi:hypothetical protein [Salinigranum salinum]|uniref:hypothetical protein n=1 Tax=Salinigranum salinum TaxID=1364937 RepID=UPI001260D857|nr:hypothetical protein [Salinigranum salinum]
MSENSNSSDAPNRVARWRCRLRTISYGAYFPLLLVAALVAPFVVSSTSSLTLFEAAEYTFAVVTVGYVAGLALLLR